MTIEATIPSGRPAHGEYADYAEPDIRGVAGDDALTALRAAAAETLGIFAGLGDDDVAGVRYASDKWSIKEVLGHLIDDERIFAYRALCVARGDTRPLPGFDERTYVEGAHFEARRLVDLLDEYRAVRAASLAFLASLRPAEWQRRGHVNGYDASARGLAFHIAGHELRHLRTLRARYLPLVRRAGGVRP
jgi:hypothetical protein